MLCQYDSSTNQNKWASAGGTSGEAVITGGGAGQIWSALEGKTISVTYGDRTYSARVVNNTPQLKINVENFWRNVAQWKFVTMCATHFVSTDLSGIKVTGDINGCGDGAIYSSAFAPWPKS